MSLRNSFMIILLFAVIPILTGGIWRRYFNTVDRFKLLLQMWVYGIITMFAITQLILVPMIVRNAKFSSFVLIWILLIGIICVSSVCLNAGWLARSSYIKNREYLNIIHNVIAKIRGNIYIFVLGAIAFVMILAQAYIAGRYQHIDDDDARFVALQTIAVEQDSMLRIDPITGSEIQWGMSEVKKDLTSPWPIYVALCSEISGLHPAAMSHVILPFGLIFLSYMAFMLIGHNLFKGNYEKIFIFLILLSVIHIFGYTSTHTTSSLMLLRMWQGKAVFAGFILPALFSVMFELFDKYQKPIWYIMLLVSATASCLASGVGVVLAAVLIFVYGIALLFKSKKIIPALCTWFTALPCAVFSLCYYFFGTIFKL